MPAHSRVTLRQIADEAGVSLMAVSYALRDNPQIKPATRERIKAIAKQLGYSPDPALSALTAYRDAHHKSRFKGVLGFLTFKKEADAWKIYNYSTVFFNAARQRAKSLGYNLEPFWARDPGQTGLEKMLRSRGIDGLLLDLPNTNHDPIPLDISRFCVVGISRSWALSGLDFVSSNHYSNSLKTWDECWRRGYRRIGYISDIQIETKFEYRLMAAFLERQTSAKLKSAEKIPPLIHDYNQQPDLKRWIKQYRPELIFSYQFWLKRSLTQLGYKIPEDIGLVSPLLSDDDLTLSGMTQPIEDLGIMGVEMVHSKIMLNQRGLPQCQKALVAEGKWYEGETLRSGLIPDSATAIPHQSG